MATESMKIINSIFKKETPLKKLAEKATCNFHVPSTYPCGTRIHTPKMMGTVWGKPHQTTFSLIKTDIFDRRMIAKKPFTLEEIVKGAFSEANKDFDDMPHDGSVRAIWGALVEEGGRKDFEMWSQQYPFPCIKPVGQIIIHAEDMKGAKQQDGKKSMADNTASVCIENTNGSSLDLKYFIGMKRNIAAIDVKYDNLAENLSFRFYRHQDQAHRKYMDEKGNYIPEKERKIVYTPADPAKPLEYYDLEADADINGPIEPPKCGTDGRFFWVTQRLPAEATFPDGFEYVMMGLVSDPGASVRLNSLQKGMGTNPYLIIGNTGKPILEKGSEGYSWLYTERACELFKDAPGVAATASLPKAGSGRVQLYVSVVTVNDAKDIFAEAKKQLLEAEKMGFEGLAKENKDWYDALYDRREEGRIAVSAPENEKAAMNDFMIEDTYRSWSIQDSGYCRPDPRNYEGIEMYAGFDLDAQMWHSLPCYNEIFPEPRMVQNRHEQNMYYCWLIEAWYEGLKGKARDIYNLPGIVLPHGYLPPTVPNPWYMENQCLDLCLDVSGEVLMVLWLMWDYRADEEMLKKLIYPAMRDLAIFYEAFARRNYDGKHYNIIPVMETENWGISYQFKYNWNTTAALTMFRKILNCAIEGAELLGVDADLMPGWREVAENLAPFPKFKVFVGEILGGNAGVIPRWTWGDHGIFTADYPAVLSGEINLDSPQEDRDIIARTNDVVRTDTWNKDAYILVGKFKDEIPSTLNSEATTITNGKQLLQELLERPERLMNSRSGRIHLFPVTPGWAEVAFRDFQARGGFLCSAAKDKDGVKVVVVKARRSVPCRIMNPWVGTGKKPVITDTDGNKPVGYTLDTANGECIVFAAEAGHEYSIDMT